MKNRLPLLFALAMVCAIPALVQAQTYNIYFGDIHSHSWYSDGNQDQSNHTTYNLPVARNITYAKSSPNMNFLGISDHNHVDGGFPMTLNLWRSGVREADSVNQDGTFVGLYGQEWGTTATGGGHSLIYGTDKLYGWNPGIYDVYVPKNNFSVLVDSLKKYNGFLYFAHPATDQFGNIFTTAYKAAWDSVVMGVAIKNGPSTSTNTSEGDPSTGNYEARYHDLLKIGYHVAPCANQDNHNTTFGRANQQRTAVLATSLTKANIIDGLRNRRTYATEDHNLELRFESGTHQMGEIFTTATPVPLRVKVVNTGESTNNTITIRYGVPGSGTAPTTLTSVSNRDSLIFSQPQANGTTYYYYAYVVDPSGDEAWSAPIWVTTSSTPPPAAFALQTPANAATGVALSGSLTWDVSTNATGYDVYLGTTTPPTTVVSSNQVGTSYNYSNLVSGTTYYWKVVAKNSTSTVDGTGSPRNFTTVVITPGAFALLTPTDGQINRPLSGNLTWESSANALTYDVYFGTSDPPTTIVSANQAGTSYAYGGLSNNTQYFWKVIAKNGAQNTTATGSPWDFTTVLNAPGSFAMLSPSNGALHQVVSGSLSWQTSTNATGYDVYFGTSNPPPLVSSNQAGTTYSYGPLPENTLSYWKIVARNASDTTIATGAPWNFTTIDPPGSFVLLLPDSGSIEKPLSGTLTWDTSASATSYDVYLDANDPPLIKVDSNVSGTNYFYENLQPSATYFWKVIAKNVDGELMSTNAPWNFTTVNVPMAPLDLSYSNKAATSLTLHWKDTASNEDGYHVYRSLLADGPFDQIGDLPSNSIFFDDASLNVDARYYYRVIPYNGSGEGLAGEININTLAVTPGLPVLTLVNGLFIHLEVNPATNPAYTKFAVKIEYDTVVAYVQQNGSVAGTPDWRTYAEWGGASGLTLSGLGCTDYTVSVQARNQEDLETAFSAPANQSLQCTSVSNNVQSGWNLVSLPVQVSDARKSVVFPSSSSQAFSYLGGYQQKDTLLGGVGYWVKFNNPENIVLNGQTLPADSIGVVSGWNIIGSISSSVGIASIIEQPSGLVSSSYFGYNGAYTVTDSIYPMQAYWVKANQPGILILSSTALQNQSKSVYHINHEESNTQHSVLTFDDGAGHTRSLMLASKMLTEAQAVSAELPPVPPQGSFDVRFASQKSTEFFNASGKTYVTLPVMIQSQLPVTFTWDISPITDAHIFAEIGTERIFLTPTGSMQIPEGIKEIRLINENSSTETVPQAFALYQNYPNPFNPSTEIKYDLPVKSMIRLKVYNLLGVEVATLVEGELEAGFHRVTWSPRIASGMYFYKIDAVSVENPSMTFQKTERMVLIK